MKDKFSTFIEKNVVYASQKYYKLMFETKVLFFDYLKNGKSLAEFKEASAKIWENIDHKYMEEHIKELENMIEARDLTGNKIINTNAKYTQVYELVDEKKFIETEILYKNTIDDYYKGRLKTVSKDYVNTDVYLSKIVNKYDTIQAIIPYFNKDGTVRSYHNIASYNSMLYNLNMNRAGWNRTMYDSELLERDLLYLPAHPFACPLCVEWQGKVYSSSGKNTKYPSKQDAIDGGVGHPNCKHQWLIYWGESQIQDDKYDSDDWKSKYESKQKIQSLQLERSKLKNDRIILEKLGNYEEVDKINQKIRRINSSIRELV